MKLVLSRKGFDSAAGRVPSPIIGGRPVSMPIPATRSSQTTYDDLGLGDVVERITARAITRDHLCHHDPMFVGKRCIFGQCDTAQSHLGNQGVGVGDVFLFFGLFADTVTGERHHRIFGYLRVETKQLVADLSEAERAELQELRHPHVLGNSFANNTVYRGEGMAASSAHPDLRLTLEGGPQSHWKVPSWLRGRGLTYHAEPWRWRDGDVLETVGRGQEFVTDLGDDAVAHEWVDQRIGLIRQ